MGQIAVRIPQEKPVYSENVLNAFCGFNEDHTFVASSGSGNATIQWQNKVKYAGAGGLKLTFTGTGAITFSSGADEMDYVVKNDGKHVISTRLKIDSAFAAATVTFTIGMKVNGVTLAENSFVFQAKNTEENGFLFGAWNTFGQAFAPTAPLEADDVVSFYFIAQSNTNAVIMYLDGLKLELDDRNLCGIPSIYSEPTGE